MEPKKYQYIDSLRGVAILLVILAHIHFYLDGGKYFSVPMLRFVCNGILGVQLFFVVSAFTLVMSHQNRKNEKHATRNFFIRRFFRIAPMFYLAIISFTIIPFHTFDVYHLQTKTVGLISSALFLNGLIPEWINSYVPGGWSIATEFMFYFTLPFLCGKIKNLNTSILFLLGSLMAAFIFHSLLAHITSNADFLYYNITYQLPIFALGIFVYWLLNDKTHQIKNTTLIVLTIVIFIFCYYTIPYHFYYTLVFALILVIQSRFAYKLFSNKILEQIGKVSFSMYLVHFAIIHWLVKFNFKQLIEVQDLKSSVINFCLMYLLVFLLAYIVSFFTHKYIEVSGQKLGKLIISKLNEREYEKSKNE